MEEVAPDFAFVLAPVSSTGLKDSVDNDTALAIAEETAPTAPAAGISNVTEIPAPA
jgi:hypothetical protein